jgi:predicted transcriptional regulator
MENEKAKFLKIFGNIPESLRRDIIAVIEEKPYTWNVAYIEIKNDTN